MDFRKAPDKPIAASHIKYPISADFFFFLNTLALVLLYLKGKDLDIRGLIAFKDNWHNDIYLFGKVIASFC